MGRAAQWRGGTARARCLAMLRDTAARTAGISPAKEKRGRHLVFDFARGCRDLPLAAFHFSAGGIFTL
jgi:hypothetical protein